MLGEKKPTRPALPIVGGLPSMMWISRESYFLGKLLLDSKSTHSTQIINQEISSVSHWCEISTLIPRRDFFCCLHRHFGSSRVFSEAEMENLNCYSSNASGCGTCNQQHVHNGTQRRSPVNVLPYPFPWLLTLEKPKSRRPPSTPEHVMSLDTSTTIPSNIQFGQNVFGFNAIWLASRYRLAVKRMALVCVTLRWIKSYFPQVCWVLLLLAVVTSALCSECISDFLNKLGPYCSFVSSWRLIMAAVSPSLCSTLQVWIWNSVSPLSKTPFQSYTSRNLPSPLTSSTPFHHHSHSSFRWLHQLQSTFIHCRRHSIPSRIFPNSSYTICKAHCLFTQRNPG